MAENHPTSFAFAGAGKVEPETAAELLNDLLPQDFPDGTPGIGAIFRPTHVDHGDTPGLDAAVTWLENELGKRNIQASDDLIESLQHRTAQGDQGILVMVWPAAPTGEETALVLAAREQGIRVLDLAAANNDLQWEPEPADDAEAAAEEETEPQSDLVSRIKSLASVDTADALLVALRAFFVEVAEEVWALHNAEQPTPAKPKASAPTVKAARPNAEEIEDPPRPPFEPPYVDPAAKKISYYLNTTEGTYRLVTARSKFRRGEEAADLTPAEVRKYAKEGKIAPDQVPAALK